MKIAKKVQVAADICLGCGVCHTACKFGSVQLVPRAQRVFTPEGTFDKMVSMAIERGKLADMIFEDRDKLSHRALGRIIGVLEKSSPFKAAMAVTPLKSAFLNAIVKGAKAQMGGMGKKLG